MRPSALAVIVIVAVLVCGPVLAQQQVPQESMDKLVDIFSAVRDDLWVRNDDYWHRGQLSRCIGMMRMITQIDPRDTEAYIDASWLMFSDPKVRDEDAEAFLREGLANNPEVSDMYEELGTFLYMRMRFDESITYLSGAVMTGAPPFIWHQLAHAYERAGRIGDCLDTWFEIESMEPDNAVAGRQIDRILHGGEPSREPEIIVNSLSERRKEAVQKKQ